MLLVVRVAHADPAAEQLFRDGQVLFKQGKLADACDRFARSQRLEPRIGTLLNLGSCLEQLGRTASAWESFLAAKAMAVTANDTRRAAEANRRARALGPKLAYLTISVPPDRVVDGFELRRNGILVDAAVWNVPVPVDPGEYNLVASAPGREPWSGDQTIAAGQRATVTVEPLVAIAATTTTTTITPLPIEPPKPKPIAIVIPIEPTSSPARRWAIGIKAGETSSLDAVYGLRLIRQVELPKGALRGIGSVLYDNFEDTPKQSTLDVPRTKQVLFGAGVEYVWLTPRFAFDVGVTAGLDLLLRSEGRGTVAAPWWGVRVSPLILRLVEHQLEAGLHLQGIQSSDRLAVFALIAVDWFVR
ncbi:hypothetical protein BH11MYX3_BH11MYX3_21310 [soil metagenome]